LDERARSRSQSALEEQDARGQNLKIDETHIGRDPSKGAEFGNQHRASSIARLREADHCEIGSAYNNLDPRTLKNLGGIHAALFISANLHEP
jgi:hypothetical protein